MIWDLQHSLCCLGLLEHRPRALSHACLWEENVLGQPQIWCSALNFRSENNFDYKLFATEKWAGKWYIDARILFVGCIEVHSFRAWLCSCWGRSWSSRYMDFSNVNTAVSAAGFTWESVGQGLPVGPHLDYVTWSEMQKLWNYLIVKAVEQQKFSWNEILILFSGMF